VEMSRKDPAVQVVEFRRNFGKTAALAAGFGHSRGEVIITIDADLQDSPAEIPNLLAKLGEGYDLVAAWRLRRRDPLSKTAPSRLFNWAVATMTGVKLHDFNCGFKAYRRAVTQEVKLYGDLHRFIPVLAHRLGFRVAEVVVSHRPRHTGRSKYGPGRLGRGFLDFLTVLFLTTYLDRPLHLFGPLGIVILAVGTLINIYMAILRYMGETIGARPLLTLGVLLMLVGLQFISVGLLGEMIRHFTYRPEAEYSIRHVWRDGEAAGDG
jgi:glycosyltransferase involved in cell wall biosynthesis